ncbi:ATP-binding protein [Candidatus Saganbacteria bacterium]|nr:ATP-binding protein [Candidatus Saganbacteria bacterium]
MYKKRQLEHLILKLSRLSPVILLAGPRQVGKTTLLEHLSKKSKHAYVSLDEFEFRSAAKSDPALFLEKNPPPLIVDEIQYAPQLLPYIKTRVDRAKGKLSYWLTGSQQFHLMKGVSESLAGRVAILKLSGISLSEETGNKSIGLLNILEKNKFPVSLPKPRLMELFSLIIRGSFPKLIGKNILPLDTFYGSYIQTYIDRDLRDLVRVGSLSSFEKFIRLCAARTAQLLNLSDLARNSDITVNTAKEWLSILEASGHVFLLRPYYNNISKRLIKSPKLYFLDTGLACYLTGWKDPKTTMNGAMAGALFETFVFSEIIKSFWNRGQEPPVWYYRTKEKEEIDILIDVNGKLYPIEIKLSSKITDSDLKGINSLKKTKMLLGKSLFINSSASRYPIKKGIDAIPWTILKYI